MRIIIFFIALMALPAWGAERVALVIGIADYEHVGVLPNATNDSAAITKALKDQGFDVMELPNPGLRRFDEALAEFREKADRSEVALIYYAGHGIEVGGRNYLIPKDARLIDERDVPRQTVPLDHLLLQISGASRLKMVVLDACRNNPFLTRMVRLGRGRNVGQGLAPVSGSSDNTLVAYAAAAGSLTPDGDEGGNSPYTAAFLEALQSRPRDVRLMMGAVRDGMRKRTGPGSEPFVYSSIGADELVLNPNGASVPAARSDAKAEEVREAQEILARLGIYDGPVGDVLSPGAAESLATFQSDSRLPATGRVDRTTLAALRAAARFAPPAGTSRTKTAPPGPPTPPKTKTALRPIGPMAQKLTVVSWGGAFEVAQRRAFTEPYEKARGPVNVEVLQDAPIARTKVTDGSALASWDVISMTAADAVGLCAEDLLERIEPDADLLAGTGGTTARADFDPFLTARCMAPQIVYSVALGYSETAYPTKKPEGVCAVFDTRDFHGKRALQRSPQGALEFALYCDGVPKERIYEVLATESGLQRALRKLDTVKEDLMWWNAGAEPMQWLQDGTVQMAVVYNGRLFQAIYGSGQEIGVAWDGQLAWVEGWVIPKGLPADRLNRARDFIRFTTGPEQLATISSWIAYGPARLSAGRYVGIHAQLGIKMKTNIPSSPANMAGAIMVDEQFWNENNGRLHRAFEAWLAR